VGRSHRFGSKPVSPVSRVVAIGWIRPSSFSPSAFSDERGNCFESASLALNVVPVVPVEHLTPY
jgi:hypothetical protein